MLRDDYAMVEKLVKGVVAREKSALQEEIAALREQVDALEKKQNLRAAAPIPAKTKKQ